MKNMRKTRSSSLVFALLAISMFKMASPLQKSSAQTDNSLHRTGKLVQTVRPAGPGKIPKPGDVETHNLGGLKIEMVWIPGGSFQMGSPDSKEDQHRNEGPVHTVDLDGFWMGKYEVTQELYEAVMGNNPSKVRGAKNPVEQISWLDAVEFCRKLSGLVADRQFRLPTEAEWEYASRAGSTTRFFFGDSDNGLDAYAWYAANSDEKTHPVGEKKPNAWGLYDIYGNVWEWCADWYSEKYYESSDRKNPQGPSSGQARVLRGGSWYNDPPLCGSTYRYQRRPTGSSGNTGFRVVCASPAQ